MSTRTHILLLALAAGVLVAPGAAFGDSVRFGVTTGAEGSVIEELDGGTDLLSGLYWEVLLGHLGLGMTYLVRFDRLDSPYQQFDNLWYLDWVGSCDLRYHLLSQQGRRLRHPFLDPFLEAGIGCAGRADISPYEEHGLPPAEGPLQLSIFGQLGGGLAFRLAGVHVGARVLWRGFNDPPPGTDFQPYPLKPFRIDFFAGLGL